MFTIKKLVLLAAIVFVLCIGLATADTGCPQVPETQGFVTSTAMSAIGTVTETDSIATIIINYAPDFIEEFPHSLAQSRFQAEYTSTYTEDTVADQGLVTYTKGMTTDTSGAATTNLYNVQTSKVLEFIGSDTGRMTSDEKTVLDGAGTAFYDETIMICPFASVEESMNPPFCNIAEEGSSVDLTLGSLTTSTAQRYIMKSAGFYQQTDLELPVSDPGVESDYTIKLTGFGDIPAMGSAEAHINVHAQEARFDFSPLAGGGFGIVKSEDLVYSETTAASGDITLFEKAMGYTSKITAPGAPSSGFD